VAALKVGASEAFNAIAKLRHDTALAKVPAVIETLKDAVEQGKVVCFAHHRDVVAAIAEAFGPVAVTLTGDTSMAARQAAVDRFQNDPTCLLFVGNIRAAGVGLTLTASSHVVFAELDWTPANVTQAEDRCHRIGQHDSVLVQHLVLEGSLDATMARMLVSKQIVLDAALDNPLAAQILSDEPIIVHPDEPVQTRHQLAGEGLYKDPQGTVWKVQRAIASGSGRLYAKRLSEPSGDFRYVPGAVTGIDPAWRMTVDEAARYGRLYGRCMVCGRALTDEGSIERGIGPICASKGWLV
jgi:ribosomal protein S14